MILVLVVLLCVYTLGAEERRVRCWVTAYCPCSRCTNGDGFTATKKMVKDIRTGHVPFPDCYGIASCWTIVPPGSSIVVPEYKPSEFFPASHAWPVDDTGGDMRKAWHRPWTHRRVRDGTIPNRPFIHIDVRFIHHASALRWRSGWYDVTIITKE